MRPCLSLSSLVAYIRKHKAVSFDELTSEFHCSYMSILRRKDDIKYITSYNQFSSGLTLRDIPTFNEFGIWGFRDYQFSKWGNLISTIKGLIDESENGLHAGELHKIMDVRVNNHLAVCTRRELITRGNDFGHPVYFSADVNIRKSQYEQRMVLYQSKHPVEIMPLSEANIIRVLVVMIKHHATAMETLMPILKSEGTELSEQSIRWVLKKYDIEKKGSPSS